METPRSTHKTTKLRYNNQVPAADRMEEAGLLRLLERTAKTIGYVFVILLVGVALYRVVADLWNKPILIDPVIVPKAMTDQGYTGLVAANRMYDEIRRIEDATQTILWRKDEVDLFSESLDIEIPDTKLSLGALIGLLEDFLHITPTHIMTELIFASGDDWHEADASLPTGMQHIVICVRVAGDKITPHWRLVTVSNPDDAIKLAAREALAMTNPYILGTYIDEVEFDYKAALVSLQEASKQHPNNSHIYDGWGTVLEDDQQYDEAISKYEQAIKIDSHDAFAYGNWCSALDNKGDYDGAIAKCQRAITLNPKFAIAYNNWCSALDNKGDYDGAIAKCQQAITLNPKYANAYLGWGNALNDKGDYDGAIAKCQRAITLNSRYAIAYNNWCNALDDKGDYDGAIAKCQQAITLNPKYANAYLGWGNALNDKGDYDSAIAKYQQAITLNPKFAIAYNNWCIALDNKGDYDGAIAK